jgi:hypothetical protein
MVLDWRFRRSFRFGDVLSSTVATVLWTRLARRDMSTVTWFFPGVGVSIVLGLLFAPAVARALSTGRLVAWLLIVSLGIVLSATLTPIRPGVEVGSVTSQLLAPSLNRSCESADVVDNLTGLVLGLIGATTFGWVRGATSPTAEHKRSGRRAP